jgi:probable DNA metabolism protein
MPDIANVMSAYIRMAFEMSESPEKAFGHKAVLKVSQVDRMVHREKHRMEAFIRFQLTTDGLFYATVEPDFNVLPLILGHFKRRYADQRWLIYDDLNKVDEVVINFNENTEGEKVSIFHDDEELYQNLWKDYFKNVNIKERKNNKLHLMHVPKRYWRHLTEKML